MADAEVATAHHERAARLPEPARPRLHRRPRRRGAGRPVHALRPGRGARPLRLPLPAGVDGARDRRPLPPPRRLAELATSNAHRIRDLATHSRARVRRLRRCDDPRPRDRERHTLRLGRDRLRLERGRRGRSGRAAASRSCGTRAAAAARARRRRRKRDRPHGRVGGRRTARGSLGRQGRRDLRQPCRDLGAGRSEAAERTSPDRASVRSGLRFARASTAPWTFSRSTRPGASRSGSTARSEEVRAITSRSTSRESRWKTVASRWSEAASGWAPRRPCTTARSSDCADRSSSPRCTPRRQDLRLAVDLDLSRADGVVTGGVLGTRALGRDSSIGAG